MVVGLGVAGSDGCGEGLVATSGILEVGEESEPTGWAWPHAEITIAKTAIPVARLAVIRSIGPSCTTDASGEPLCLADLEHHTFACSNFREIRERIVVLDRMISWRRSGGSAGPGRTHA